MPQTQRGDRFISFQKNIFVPFFVLLILEESEVPYRDEILSITIVTVALSILLHGVSAAPLAKLYGKLAARMGECEESQDVTDLPLREGNTSIDDH